MLYRSIRAHYSAAASLRRILGSGDRPANRTQGETGENANDPEGEGHARKSCSVRRTEQEGDNYAEVFKVFFLLLLLFVKSIFLHFQRRNNILHVRSQLSLSFAMLVQASQNGP